MHSPLLSALLLTLAATATLAFPNGAPGCVVNEQRISKMGGKNTKLGFSIQPSSKSYQPGKPVKFTLKGNSYYKGLLLYVSSGSDDKLRVGNFKIPKGFHSNKDKCDAQGYQASPNGALTHSNPSKKQPGTQFTWTPEKEAACETVEIHAVVAKEKQQWQILPIVKLTCKDDGGEEPYDDDKEPADQYDQPADEYDEHGDKIEYDEYGKKKPCKKGKKPAGEKEYETPAEYPAGGEKEYETPAEYPTGEEGEKKKKKKCKKGKKPAEEYTETPAEYPAGGEKEYETPAEYPTGEEGEKKKKKKCKKGKKPAEYPTGEEGEKKKKKKCKKGKKPAEEYETPAGGYDSGDKKPDEEYKAPSYDTGDKKPASDYGGKAPSGNPYYG